MIHYDDVTYNKSNRKEYGMFDYEIDTDGIGSKSARLRLKVESNLEADFNLGDIYSNEMLLGKSASSKKLTYKGQLEVKDYALAQNYPNPFNPTTKINYTMPQAGKVSLVVYDALGREVMTLVDAHKEKCRYDAQFNAENLSSGVYIYRLKVNDFVESRKMLLLK